MKAASIAMAALFLYAVAVQYNDVDPARWMALYGTAAIFSVLSAFRRVPVPLLLILALLSLIWAATLVPLVIGKQSLVDSEEGRELLGLGIVAVWMVVLAVWLRSRSREQSSSNPV